MLTSSEFKAIRHELGYTQKELAEIMGIGTNEIGRIETDRKPTRIQSSFLLYIKAQRKEQVK